LSAVSPLLLLVLVEAPENRGTGQDRSWTGTAAQTFVEQEFHDVVLPPFGGIHEHGHTSTRCIDAIYISSQADE
jgi:hypothetical protein